MYCLEIDVFEEEIHFLFFGLWAVNRWIPGSW